MFNAEAQRTIGLEAEGYRNNCWSIDNLLCQKPIADSQLPFLYLRALRGSKEDQAMQPDPQ
ncbi:MAG TPA: hypothetical protein DEF47_12025 [Herpetosiphon sp.]|nr:hypothetical protein [Herpetosiphon sp.]